MDQELVVNVGCLVVDLVLVVLKKVEVVQKEVWLPGCCWCCLEVMVKVVVPVHRLSFSVFQSSHQ